MKERPKGFLDESLIDHDSEQFNYIVELHGYLWRFVEIAIPGAGGSLSDYLPAAIKVLEGCTISRPNPRGEA